MLLGIDLGTTVLKVAAFAERTGAPQAQATRRLPVRAFKDGGREQRPRQIDRAFKEAVAELRQCLGASWRTVAGVGLAAQGGSTLIVERVSGHPLTPMLLWNDGRAERYMGGIAARTTPQFWQRFTLRNVPPAGLGRLLWLKATHPGLFKVKNLHVGAGEYLFFKMTGVWRQDAGNAIQIGSYNAVAEKLAADALDLVDVPLSFVAPLRQGHETAPLSREGARLLGLPAGIPVAGPYIDQEAAYLSAVGTSGRPLQCSLGTAWVGNFALPKRVGGWSPFQLVLPNPAGDGKLAVQPLLTGNAPWDWALETFLDSDHDTALSQANRLFRRALLPPRGLIVVPWLTQPNPLNRTCQGGGTFFGVSASTTKADLIRAVAAGMAFELARMFDEVKRSGIADAVVLGGGASRGWFFRTLIAALFGPLPVYRQTYEALAAAAGAVFAFSPKAARLSAKQVTAPARAALEEIRERYIEYLAVFDRLYKSVPEAAAYSFKGSMK